MFKYLREMRQMRKTKLQVETLLMSKLYNFVDGMPDIVALAKRAKDLDATELQKAIVEELVNYAKKQEENDSEDTDTTPTDSEE